MRMRKEMAYHSVVWSLVLLHGQTNESVIQTGLIVMLWWILLSDNRSGQAVRTSMVRPGYLPLPHDFRVPCSPHTNIPTTVDSTCSLRQHIY